MNDQSLLPTRPQEQSDISDEVLVSRLCAGDTAAGDLLVRRYAKTLLGYLHRLTGNAALAEDLHQQTWVSVLENLDRFDFKSSTSGFRPWLFRIATNKVSDQWRSQARKRKVHDTLRISGEIEAEDASVPMQLSEDIQRLEQAIQELPEPQRQVVCMRFYSKMKFADIAAALGCPLNTALGRMHKALAKLRKSLE